jgi:hypothetical protein
MEGGAPSKAPQADPAGLGSDIPAILDEPNECGIMRGERESVLPDPLVVTQVPVELGLAQPAHDHGHGRSIGEFTDDLWREETRGQQVEVRLKVKTEEKEQRNGDAVRDGNWDDGKGDGRELGPGVKMWGGGVVSWWELR